MATAHGTEFGDRSRCNRLGQENTARRDVQGLSRKTLMMWAKVAMICDRIALLPHAGLMDYG